MSRPLNRIVPKAPARAFKTYGMHITAREPVSCELAGCSRWPTGWASVVPANSEDEATIEAACRGEVDGYRRRWESATVQPDGFVRYVFPPGQPCFRASTHSIPLTAQYTLRDGDWRGNPSGRIVTTDNAQTWIDDFGEHQQKIIDQRRAMGAE